MLWKIEKTERNNYISNTCSTCGYISDYDCLLFQKSLDTTFLFNMWDMGCMCPQGDKIVRFLYGGSFTVTSSFNYADWQNKHIDDFRCWCRERNKRLEFGIWNLLLRLLDKYPLNKQTDITSDDYVKDHCGECIHCIKGERLYDYRCLLFGSDYTSKCIDITLFNKRGLGTFCPHGDKLLTIESGAGFNAWFPDADDITYGKNEWKSEAIKQHLKSLRLYKALVCLVRIFNKEHKNVLENKE